MRLLRILRVCLLDTQLDKRISLVPKGLVCPTAPVSQGGGSCIQEIDRSGFCLIVNPNVIYKKLMKFVRKFYLLAWIEKDRDSSK